MPFVSNAEQAIRAVPQPGPRAGRRVLAILALAAVAIVVQSCGDDRNRPLVYDKGTYQGPVDEQLDQDQLDALRRRAARQQAQF